MKRETLLKKMAPCGLVCHTCVAARGGVISELGKELLRLLGSFDGYAEALSQYEPRLKKYPQFREVLGLICEAGCEGCRNGQSKYPGCTIPLCEKERGVDFCHQCPDFPCDRADFDPLFKAKWLKANERMKEIGAEAFFEEVKDRSHYESPR